MEYAKLWNTDIEVSKLCVGCMSFGKAGTLHDWTVDETGTEKIVKHALDLGINFFDTANGYSEGASEEYLGRALAEKYGVKMQQIALAWEWAKGVTSPIIGATKAAHFDDAAGAFAVRLTQEDTDFLEEPYVPHRIVGAIDRNPEEGVRLLDVKK